MGSHRRSASPFPKDPANGRARWRLWSHWRVIPLMGLGLSAPAALAQVLGGSDNAVGVNAPGVNNATCRTMELPLVYALTLSVALGAFLILNLVKRRLTREGWSLANALSEPTQLAIPVESRWTASAGDQLSLAREGAASRKLLQGSNGKALAVMLLEASSSRMIATLGGLGILMLYMGFGTFALYSFGLTCQLPASMTAVTTFLLSGLSLFAPYVANKVSSAIQPRIRTANPEPPAPSPTPEADAPNPLPEPAHPGPAAAPAPSAPSPPAQSDPFALAQAAAPAAAPSPASPLNLSSAQAPASAPAPAPAPAAAPAPAPAPAPTAATATAAAPAPAPAPASAPSPARAPAPASAPAPAPAPAPSPAAAPAPAPRPASAQTKIDAASQAYGPALAMIRTFEGFAAQAYPDPASGAEPWTIGYGFTTLAGQPVRPGQTITSTEAEEELQRQVVACADHLAATIPDWGQMTRNQRCALLDFAWNLGADFYGDTDNFASITRDLQTRDWQQVPQTLLLYCDPGTNVEAGLLRRRQAEADLWRRPEGSAAVRATPAATIPTPSGQPPHSGSRFTNPLKVPYCDQLKMADGQGWRECFSASSAMLAMFWGKEPNENVYDTLRARYGDSTSSESQLDALRSLGLVANFQTDGTAALLEREIDAGRPVAVGWLCDGPVSAPSGGGHWIVIIGYDATGFFVNDPYGNCDLVNGGYLSHHDGAGLHYSFTNWLPRWRVGGSGGWMLTCHP